MEKSIVRFMFYFGCILLVGWLDHYALEFARLKMWSFTRNLALIHIYEWTYPIAIGILLGLIILITKPRVDKFSYDGVMALGLGIPLAYVSLYFIPMLSFNITLPYIPSFNYTTSGILLGFVLVAAIKGIPRRK